MKHGPIALIDQHLPIVALMPNDAHREKTLSNLQEAAARDGRILALVTEGDHGPGPHRRGRPAPAPPSATPGWPRSSTWSPCSCSAYHIAVLRGCDVDQPRNLAKSVTVE